MNTVHILFSRYLFFHIHSQCSNFGVTYSKHMESERKENVFSNELHHVRFLNPNSKTHHTYKLI